MNPIMHVAIKVADLDRAIAFYTDTFGYAVREIRDYDGHRSCHLEGAGIDLSLMHYESEEAPEATLAGRGPAIHHIGIEVDDLEAAIGRLEAHGCEILSPRAECR